MLLCSTCNEEIFDKDDIQCSKCEVFIHFTCAGLREASFRSYTDNRKKSWCCIKCREGSSKIVAINKNIKSIPAMEDCNIVSKKQLLDLTKSINFMSKQFDDFPIQIRDLVNSVKEIKEENRHVTEQNIKLKSEVSIINKRINVIEQEQFSKPIELIGLPEQNNENCIKTVENISVAVGGKVNMENAYRVRSKMTGKPGKIVAILKSIDKKINFMNLVKTKRLSTTDINENWKKEGIYVNNYLTQTYRNLFFKTKLLAKEKNYKFVWFKNNKLFVRKNNDTNAIPIEDENSLSKLV